MTSSSFVSQGNPFQIYEYPSRADGKKYPAILLLHGNAGLTEPYGDQIRGFAEDLSRLGYFAAVPKYYQDDVPHLTDTTPHAQILSDAIENVSKRLGVDPARIGLIGFSLGATTCMTLISSQPKGSISVFADFFGFLTQDIRGNADRFPPTIMFHNKDDIPVPVTNSEELDKLLSAASVTHHFVPPYTEDWQELHHSFEPGGSADKDSRQRATEWFVKYLPPVGI